MTLAPDPWAFAADLIAPPDDTWKPEPHQIAPPGRWFIWMLLGGRGAGKTATCARHMYDHCMGPPCIKGVPGGHWPAIIGPTLGDAVTSAINGPSGLRLHDPGVKVRQTAGGTQARMSNGTEIKLFGAHTEDDVERLRSGGNRCLVWAEELAAWRWMEESWQHIRYGLRAGPWPHIVASTTPKNRLLIKQLLKDAISRKLAPNGHPQVVITRATTNDNPHLPAHIRQMLFDDYGGTRLGRQELNAEILEDVDGALWTPSMIEVDRMRIHLAPTNFDNIIVSIDPAIKSEGGNEHGIVTAGRIDKYLSPEQEYAHLPHGFVLADDSLHGSPSDWAHAAIEAFHDWRANAVVGEINNGGDMVKATIHNIDPTIPFIAVHATRGKAKRAEPISALYEQHRVHHVGMFGHLEDQMTGWDASDPPDDWSPDRMDAMVWALHQLLGGRGTGRISNTEGRRSTLRGTR